MCIHCNYECQSKAGDYVQHYVQYTTSLTKVDYAAHFERTVTWYLALTCELWVPIVIIIFTVL